MQSKLFQATCCNMTIDFMIDAAFVKTAVAVVALLWHFGCVPIIGGCSLCYVRGRETNWSIKGAATCQQWHQLHSTAIGGCCRRWRAHRIIAMSCRGIGTIIGCCVGCSGNRGLVVTHQTWTDFRFRFQSRCLDQIYGGRCRLLHWFHGTGCNGGALAGAHVTATCRFAGWS